MQALLFFLFIWVTPGFFDLQEHVFFTAQQNRLILTIEAELPANNDLILLREAGFTFLEMNSQAHSGISSIPEEFTLLYNIGLPYLLPYHIAGSKDAILQELFEHIHRLPEDHLNRIAAIGLFQYPLENADFYYFSDSAIDSLRSITDTPFYYHSHHPPNLLQTANFQFIITDFFSDRDVSAHSLPSVIYFRPADNYKNSIIRLQETLNQAGGSAVMLPANWAAEALQRQPGLVVLFQEFLAGQQVALPLPANGKPAVPPNWPLIVFWVLIGGVIILIKYYPLVPQYIGRYFFNHSFFMQDIIEGRVRNIKSSLFFLGIQSLFSGLFVYCFLNRFFNESGFDVIAYYMDWGILSLNPAFTFAAASIIFSVLVHTISVFWLYLSIKNINYLYKAVHLYAWGFIIQIFLAIALVVASPFSLPLPIIVAAGAIYYAAWVSNFLLAAWQGAKKLEKKRITILFLTSGLYVVFAILFLVVPFQSDLLANILQLAHQLSR